MAEEQPERLWMVCVPASLTPEYMARLNESGALVYSSLGMMFSGIALVREAMQLARRGVEATWLRSWKPQAAGGPSRTQAILVHDEAKQMLGRRGIAFPAERIADPDDIGVATAELAMPVALKLLSHERLHKAAADALALDLASPEAVVAAASRMQPAAGERFLIQQMVSAGLDIFLGYQEDARYGGMLLIGAGGSEVERLRDVQTVLLPATGEDLRAALRRLRMADTLFANGPAGTIWDVEAVIGAAEAFAAFVSDGHDGLVVAAEINPLRVLGRGKGALALDARVVLAM
jgi:acyl-CoA synthetase (NDP forming)